MNNFSPKRLKELAHSLASENRSFFKKLKKLNPNTIDELFHNAHQVEFAEFNCISCSNCCKTISPIITFRDVERIAKGLKEKPSAIVEKYMKMDADGDYVFRLAPCPFLDTENLCSVYQNRPKACREYPHTDRKRMHQILNLTLRNVEVCPVVFRIVERIKADNYSAGEVKKLKKS